MKFESMIGWIRRTFATVFGRNANDKIDVLLSNDMSDAIARWAKIFEGRPPWLGKNMPTVGLAPALAAEVARLVVMEASIAITGSVRADYLSTQLEPLRLRLQNDVHLAAAMGGLLLKPLVSEGRIVVDAVQADCFYPIAFDSSGRMTSVVTAEQITRKGTIYTRLEYHSYLPGQHVIQNRAFASTTDVAIGKPIALDEIPEWASLSPEWTFTGVDRPLFAYLRMPFANRIDRASPLGVSIYAGAEHLLQDADEQYGRFLWEFEGGELAIDLAEDYIHPGMDDSHAFQMPKGKQRLFRGLRMQDKNFYNVFSPTLRDASLKNGFNTILQRIEFNCGLAYGTLSDPQQIEKTAEEIRAGKQRSYATVSAIQRAVESAVDDLVYAMDVYSSQYHLAPSGAYSVACDWGDSIVNDPQQRKTMFWQYVQAGKFPFWRYLVEFEGYTEEEARKIQSEQSQQMGDPYAEARLP